MPLATMTEIIGPARAAGRGVCAFNVIGIEHAEAIARGAERANAPVILQISQNCVAYHGALEPIARACLAVARSATAPVAVHLDHAADAELIHEAAGLGLGSVMFDASRLPYAENVLATAEVVAWCHRRESGSRPSSARSAARTACTRRLPAPIPARRPGSSWPPRWTRSRSRSGARTLC
jgi:fructose-bisphosphate aldolase class II